MIAKRALLLRSSARSRVGYWVATVAATLTVIFVSSVHAQSVSKSYIGNDGTQTGMLVQIDDKDKNRVKPGTASKPKSVIGVVVMPNDAPLSLSQATNERQVFVASNGNYKLLVSDQNGPIKKDDFIVVSSIDGVGMLADKASGIVAARAVSGFDGEINVMSQTKITDSKGKEREIRFGYIQADIGVGSNPLYQDPKVPTGAPGVLKRIAESIAGKQVSLVKIYISLFIALLTSIIVIVVMTTGIRTSVTALGRNPLARQSILRNLTQVLMIGLAILIVGLFGVYLLLKL